MADAPNKPSIFQKMLDAGNAVLDAQILKAKTTIINSNIEDDFLYSKAITEDPNYSTHAQGWKDKPFRVQNSHLKQMSTQSSPVASVIQTRQNQVSNHATLVKAKQDKGFMICLVDEEELLEKIKEELREEMEENDHPGIGKDAEENQEEQDPKAQPDSAEQPLLDEADPAGLTKADPDLNENDRIMEGADEEDDKEDSAEDAGKTDDQVEEYNWELERKAREILNKKFEKARKAVEQYVLNCGNTDNRPFETKKWNFQSALRAWTRDTLTYDLYATEIVPDRVGRPHHWFPVDAGCIKFSSASLKNYKDMAETFINMDILYPENNKVNAEKQKVIDLDPKLLEKDQYKYVQVIRGKVERAYTQDELKIGIRNVTTDIYVNGYGVSELELLVSLVTGHLNAEFYNQAYFTQGFSAKGILHIKSAIPRRKLESVRQQWSAMVKGARNSFQTPIFAGVEDVKWIPLTQSHNDIGFEGWMRYLVTMICSIYQIDPTELGIYFKQEGSGGGLNGGDKTDVKMSQSKDKGLFPLMNHIQGYINENIIKPFDSRFMLKFTGLADETVQSTLDRQEKEVKFKKTVNEIRAEDGLPPLPGMDDVILDPQYMAWYNAYSAKAQAKVKDDQSHQLKQGKQQADALLAAKGAGEDDGKPAQPPEEDLYGEGAAHSMTTPPPPGLPVNKSLNTPKVKTVTIETYQIKK
jgi:hypothetical protein